jgi:predicted TIM-barrel fold metal-dependent hydrolase
MSDDRMIIVSLDCHIDPANPRIYSQYLEDRYQDDFRGWVDQIESVQDMDYELTKILAADYLEVRGKVAADFFERMGYDEERYHHRVQSSRSMTDDPEVRLKELEADGIVAEILFPNGTPPLGDLLGGFQGKATDDPRGRELATAGIRAYNRWIADICQAHPGRRIGTAMLPAPYDIDEVVDVIRTAKEAGLGAVVCPSPTNPGLPPLFDAYWEPVWATCAELDMPLQCHLGWGGGGFVEQMLPGSLDMFAAGGYGPITRLMVKTESYFLSRRALWILIWSGAFDRHPNLKLMFVEQQADWVPNTLRFLDSVDHRQIHLGRDPSGRGRHGGGVVYFPGRGGHASGHRHPDVGLWYRLPTCRGDLAHHCALAQCRVRRSGRQRAGRPNDPG